MILASLVNKIGCSTSSAVLSKSTTNSPSMTAFHGKAVKEIKDEF